MNATLTIVAKICFFLLAIYLISSCSANKTTKSVDLPPLSVVAVNGVDLDRYSGKWYEIASLPQRFQKGCTGTTATYTLSEENSFVKVYNKCFKDSLTGSISDIEGKAFVVPESGNAKLKVQFFWPFKADYWIIFLDENYQYAAVSHPNGKYLWILSRTPDMPDSLYATITKHAFSMGIDTLNLQKTIHGDN
ncbi:MAG: lipocalin family protein [Schleiferiaceae bacterium]|nr:lipocalin family protein [Schleiferiaceae bacterium]